MLKNKGACFVLLSVTGRSETLVVPAIAMPGRLVRPSEKMLVEQHWPVGLPNSVEATTPEPSGLRMVTNPT